MRAIRVHEFGGPEVMRLDDVPVPTPGPGDVVVRLGAIGVNPVDTYIRAGTYARLPQLPFTPGSDGAGTVEAVGAEVTDLTPGARVYVAPLGMSHSGSYADVIRLPRAGVRPLPDGISYAQGAAIGIPYMTAARAVFDRARLDAGETVLVHGASGGVGVAVLQFARAIGARAIGTAGSQRGAELVAAQGAHVVVHKTSGYEKRILDITGGRGVDVVVEMLANVNLTRDFEFLTTGGRIVVIGSRGALDFNPRLLMAKEASVSGTMLWNVDAPARERLFTRVDAGLASGYLRPVIGTELPLADAQEAHRAVLAPGASGKIVLVP
jgi:NADPH2:quinone reductase